ncbi:MAG: two-component sensor histidine kinase [Planctomycetes bacterium]|nr:two-component sensor histidine kinase [Planctomycetota bacterium]
MAKNKSMKDFMKESREMQTKLLEELASGLAHEIKNPLSTLNLNLEVLLEDWKDSESQREKKALKRIKIMSDEIQRLERIVNEFLNFARDIETIIELTDIKKLINTMLNFVEPELKSEQITVWTEFGQNLPLVPADSQKLKQVLLNLIINSRHAINEKGSGEIFIKVNYDDTWLYIEIIDTGKGISTENHEKIFDVYFSTKKKGTGLGLATAKRIIENHDGILELVMSEIDTGTNFRIKLPLYKSA